MRNDLTKTNPNSQFTSTTQLNSAAAWLRDSF